MDLSSLYTTLASPPGQLQQAEVDMMEKFKVAALSITNLYKSSVLTSKVSYKLERLTEAETDSYLDDMYSMRIQQDTRLVCKNDIQQILQSSLSGSSATASNQHVAQERLRQIAQEQDASAAGRTLARLMDWIEARQEAMKLEEEEEKEEEQREAEAAREREDNKRRLARQPTTLDSDTPRAASAVEPSNSLRPVNTDMTQHRVSPAPPSAGIKQRDALVKAVELARSRSRSASAQRVPSSTSAPGEMQSQQDSNVAETRSEPMINIVSSPIAVSSPVAPSSPAATFTTRPLKPYPLHHQKSNGRMSCMKASPAASQFKPSLPETIPFFPLFQSSESINAFDGMTHGTDVPDNESLECGIGGKRSHESVFGGSPGVNSFTTRSGSGRRRGAAGDRDASRHHTTKGLFGGKDTESTSEDDRQRKRQTRR
ncbi:hypothetical protein QFC22_000710 [Naganishia vaughanmartiniae]|uniref:Uncharacterized protein n=1 Tax=Naganishia vaughanmartiniae TaxID=1424756 RepID=A0ACC2XKF1_9TREE|nr:hypothetical protein QFC22_000710 [Naganishia vaughanmartiniae]